MTAVMLAVMGVMMIGMMLGMHQKRNGRGGADRPAAASKEPAAKQDPAGHSH